MKLTASPLAPGARVLAYLRDSGGEDQDLSVPQQEQSIREWCQANGLQLTEVYADMAAPGSSVIGRARFLAMIRHLHSDEASEAGVLIWRSNRFGRNINDTQYYKADLRRRGYLVHSLTDAIPEGSAGRLVEFALDWKDEVFLEQLSEDVRRGLRYIVEHYRAVPGNPPRGFRRVPVTVGARRDGSAHILHHWEPDPELIPLVQQAFEMRARGASLMEIARATGLYKSKNCWVTFFSNELYKGILHYADLVIPDYCAPLVDPALWAAANAAKHARIRPDHPRRAGADYPLSGLVHCSECGSLLSIHTLQGYEYYDCARKMRDHTCKARAIPRAPLEQIIFQTLKQNVLTYERLAEIQAHLQAVYASGKGQASARRESLLSQQKQTKQELSNLVAAIRAYGHSSALLADLKTAEAQLTTLTAELDLLRDQLTPPPAYAESALRALAADLQAGLDTDPQAVRSFLRGFVLRILAERTESQIHGAIEYLPPQNAKSPRGGGDFGKRGSAPIGTQAVYQITFSIPIKPHKAPRRK